MTDSLMSDEKALEVLDPIFAYRSMLMIRRFEEICLRLHRKGEIAGSMHLCCGQEAIPVGIAKALTSVDRIVATYRGHGWAIASGVPLRGLLAEICGRANGINGGRAGSAYLSAPEQGFLGENSVVAGGLPFADGVALAQQVSDSGGVTIVSFGDGATNQGAAHEALVQAVARHLPIIFVCENNQWSEMTPISSVVPVDHLSDRAAAYGLPALSIDGDDVDVVHAAAQEAILRARNGGGPTFIECMTHRLLGHYQSDFEHYRSVEDRQVAGRADPLVRLRSKLLLTLENAEARLSQLEEQVTEELSIVEAEVMSSASPSPDTAREHVTSLAKRDAGPASLIVEGEKTYLQAVNFALSEAMRHYPQMVIFGEDVAIPGGVFGATKGLLDEFGPVRVFDTPIAESAILGMAVGSAGEGLIPVAEIMWIDFLLVALDQLVNQAANVRYINRGSRSAPLVIRCQQGATPGSCAQHSQSLEAILAHIPGLKVGLPSTPQDAYSMLIAAIADPDPCVIIESRALYATKGPVRTGAMDDMIGTARWRHLGDDVALVSWGTAANLCHQAAIQLEEEGIDVRVLDLRWLSPLDDEALESAASVGKVLIVHEANVTGGFGAEIAARLVDKHFSLLDAPVRRLGVPDTRMPASPVLQRALLPSIGTIREAVISLHQE